MTTVAKLFETMDYGPAPESDAPALEWIKQHGGQFGHFIGGRWTPPAEGGGKYFDTINPATTAVLAQVAQGGKADVDAAVAAARAAAPGWAALTPHARSRSSRGTSTTTPAGPSCGTLSSRTASPSASWARSSPGTSRC